MPNTVVKLTNAESTWLEAAREDRKLLIKLKRTSAKMSFLLSFGSRFMVQGSGLRWRLRRLFYWAMPESDIQDTGYSHNNDMSSPLEKGRAKGAGWICPAGASFYVADNALLVGIVSHI